MFESPVKKRDLILFSIFSLMIVFVIFLSSFFDSRTKIVFCNVGQGDAIYIRINNQTDVLIDAGPDKSVLSCLGKYMPFWDRKIELAFLSHPNSDHYNGYLYIVERYKIDKFITVRSPFTPKTFLQLTKRLINKKIPIKYLVEGDSIGPFSILWPPNNFVSNNDNDFSMVMMFNGALFTGDASAFVLGRLSHGAISKIDILKVPHHGSKNGLINRFLDLADPGVAVISVGRNNSFGHPSKIVLDMLKAKNIKIRRTDMEGDIFL